MKYIKTGISFIVFSLLIIMIRIYLTKEFYIIDAWAGLLFGAGWFILNGALK